MRWGAPVRPAASGRRSHTGRAGSPRWATNRSTASSAPGEDRGGACEVQAGTAQTRPTERRERAAATLFVLRARDEPRPGSVAAAGSVTGFAVAAGLAAAAVCFLAVAGLPEAVAGFAAGTGSGAAAAGFLAVAGFAAAGLAAAADLAAAAAGFLVPVGLAAAARLAAADLAGVAAGLAAAADSAGVAAGVAAAAGFPVDHVSSISNSTSSPSTSTSIS
jgi:hypothetical protein